MSTHHEKILYFYSRALEDADFEAISEIMTQAAHDSTLKALLFDLETAYQSELQELAVPKLVEVSMLDISKRSNGYHPAPAILARRPAPRPRAAWVWRAAALLVVLAAAVLVIRTSLIRSPNGITSTRLAPDNAAFSGQNPTPVPLGGHPVITAQNADQLVEIQRYGTGVVYGMTWSPDSRTLLYYGAGLWFYDAETLSQTHDLDTGTVIYDAAYSPDGTRIATANQDGTIRLYDAASGAEQLVISAYAGRIAFSPDGRLIASSGGQGRLTMAVWTVAVWDAFTGRERLAFHDFNTYVGGVKFSPDGTLLAAAGDTSLYLNNSPLMDEDRNVVFVWDIPSGEQRLTLLGPTEQIHTLAFQPDGTQLIAGGLDGSIYQWDITPSATTSGGEERDSTKLYVHQREDFENSNPVSSLAYSPDGTWIVSLNRDMNMHLWKGDEIRSATFRGPDDALLTGTATGLAYRPDGRQLAVIARGGRSLVWDMADPTSPTLVGTVDDHNPDLSSLDISATAAWITAGSWSGGAWVWNTATGDMVNQLPGSTSPYVLDVAFDPTSTQIAIGQMPDLISPSSVPNAPQYGLLLWSPDPGVPPVPLDDDPGDDPWGNAVNDVAFSADGTRLFATHQQGVRVWDVTSRRVLNELRGNDQGYYATQLAPSPAGDVVAFIDNDRDVRLWNVVTGEELPPLTGFPELVRALAFNPDGSQLAALDDGGNLTIWDTATWTEAWYVPHTGELVGHWAVTFSSDGTFLAQVGNEGITLWDVKSHRPITSFVGNLDGMYDVVFSQDGTLLVTAGGDGLVRVWAVP